MWGHRVIIPVCLRKQLLDELHTAHFGINKLKSMAREVMYWPKLDQEIENLVKSCMPCLMNKQNPLKSLTPWPEATKPFERVHIDHLQLNQTMCLVMVYAYSRWPEVFSMKSTDAVQTEEKLRETFARFGLPRVVVSDNGPQLVSK